MGVKVTQKVKGKPKKVWVWQSPWKAEKTGDWIIDLFYEGKAGWDWTYHHLELRSLHEALSLLAVHGKLSEVEVVKETKARYYLESPYKDKKPRMAIPKDRWSVTAGDLKRVRAKKSYFVKPQQHVILNKANLETQGWDICLPLKRIFYNTKDQAENLSFYKSEYYKMVAPKRDKGFSGFWEGIFGDSDDASDNVPPAEARVVWRKLVKQFHPDHGGDPQEFDIIQKAFKPLIERR